VLLKLHVDGACPDEYEHPEDDSKTHFEDAHFNFPLFAVPAHMLLL
jgi:hypothetical protein